MLNVWNALKYLAPLTLFLSLLAYSTLAEEDETSEEIFITSHRVLDCTGLPEPGEPGSSKGQPLKISIKKLLKNSQKYNCHWIQVSGYFRWDNYDDYPAALYLTEKEFKREQSLYNLRDKLIRFENFIDHKKPEFDFQDTTVTVVALFYDLCYQQDLDVKTWPGYKEGMWVMTFGPCHYSNVRLFKDAVFSFNKNEDLKPLSEKQFTEHYGDVVQFPEDSNYINDIRSASLKWLSYIQKGDFEAFYETFHFSDADVEEVRANTQEEIPLFYETFFSDMHNPLNKSGVVLDRLGFKVFAERYWDSNNNIVIDENMAIVCFCLDDSCSDFNPIFEREMKTFEPPNLCVWLEKVEKDNSKVEWVWWEVEDEEEEEEE